MTPRDAVVAVLPRLKARQRSRRRAKRLPTVRRVLMAGAVVLLLAGGGWALLDSSLVGVREVTVQGTSRLTVAQVLAAAHVKSGESLIRIDPSSIARRVEALPAVARATVSRSWPHRIVIDVVERKALAVVNAGSGPTLLDGDGVPFATVATAPRGLVSVIVGAPVPGAGDADARAAMQVLVALPTSMRADVVRVHAPSPYNVSLDLRNGRVVVWGSAEDSSTKAVELRTLLRRQARVYDVSAPGIAVTR